MRVWRISEFLSVAGEGGKLSIGRWHNVGRPILYTAESPAVTLLEALVRFDDEDDLAAGYQLLEIEVPKAAMAEWQRALPKRQESRAWGDDWLAGGKTGIAKVPSAVAPHSFNYLINPLHPDVASVRLVEAQRWDWDERLAH